MRNLRLRALLITGIIVLFACSKEEPPAPGEKTRYPDGSGTWTFFVDATTCFSNLPLSMTMQKENVFLNDTTYTIVRTDTVYPAYPSSIVCDNSNDLGTRLDLQPGRYLYEAYEINGTYYWEHYIEVLSGDCETYRMWCQ